MLMKPQEFATDTQPFVPPRLTRRAALLAKRLAPPRTPAPLSLGWTAEVLPVSDGELWQESGVPIEVVFRVGGETAVLRTVWAALETFVYQAEPRVRITDLSSSLVAALIEARSTDALDRAETLSGTQITVETITDARDHGDRPRLDLALRPEEVRAPFPAVLFASPGLLGLVASAWERNARTRREPLAPGFLLAARVALSSVTRAGLRGLEVGDALLFDRVAPDGGIILCLGEHLAAVAQISETGEVIPGEPFTRQSPLSLGEFLMSDENTDERTAMAEEGDLASLPVRLVFELGRTEVSLDDIRDLAVGAPIMLDRPATSVVDILANGRKVGSGEMVLIGDQLGVRITRLSTDA